jgi:hypothetical protein
MECSCELKFHVRNIREEIHNAFIWAGSEKFVSPLLKELVSRYVQT